MIKQKINQTTLTIKKECNNFNSYITLDLVLLISGGMLNDRSYMVFINEGYIFSLINF